MQNRLDEYKHLDKDMPAAIIRKDGITIYISTDELVQALKKSNRGIARLASALYHEAKKDVEREVFLHSGCWNRYAEEHELKANACKTLAERWIF